MLTLLAQFTSVGSEYVVQSLILHYAFKNKIKNTDLSSSIYKQAGVAVDAFAPTQVMIVTTVHCSNPDHAIHLLCKVPPLKQETYIETY